MVRTIIEQYDNLQNKAYSVAFWYVLAGLYAILSLFVTPRCSTITGFAHCPGSLWSNRYKVVIDECFFILCCKHSYAILGHT